MKVRRRRALRALLAATAGPWFVAACTTPNLPSGLDSSPTQRWQGRFSVTLIEPASSGNSLEARQERAQGRFALSRSPDNLELALFSPFGQTLANATSTAAGSVLTTSEGQTFRADNPDTLIERALGWRLPVAAMPDWLAGRTLPAGSEPVERAGWNVTVEQRFDSGEPRRLAARWPLDQRFGERRINLFLVVDQPA